MPNLPDQKQFSASLRKQYQRYMPSLRVDARQDHVGVRDPKSAGTEPIPDKTNLHLGCRYSRLIGGHGRTERLLAVEYQLYPRGCHDWSDHIWQNGSSSRTRLH